MDLVTTLWATISSVAVSFIDHLPYVFAAFVVVALGFWLARYADRSVRAVVMRVHGDRNLALALGRLTRFLTVLVGFLIAAVIVFPGLKPADVVAFLGLSSVAIGFAFKDIFQNFLAGLLLLFRKPFRLGDQIRTADFEGTVEDINLRVTVIHTYDGERVLVPNATVFTNSVLVRTAYGRRRSRFDVGIGYGDDINEAKRVITAVLRDAPGVLDDPAPLVHTVELAPSQVTLRVLYWTRSEQADVLQVGDRVVTAIKYALDDAGIDMPFPVSHVVFDEPVIEAIHGATDRRVRDDEG